MKICIFIPFYGKWPIYVPLYMMSLERNPWFDVVFITNLDLPENSPENAKRIFLSREEFVELYEEKLNISPNLDNPYKLCDLRPSFGYVFEEYLEDNNYSFWGWGDIDLLYGEVSKFYSKEDFEKYDVISGRKKWVSGGLTFLRNSVAINQLFLESDDYKEVFKSPDHFSYSECGKVWKELIDGESIFNLEFGLKNFTLMVMEKEKSGDLRLKFEDVFKESIKANGFVSYDKGRVLDEKNDEFLLFHYVMTKRKPYFTYPKWQKVKMDFFITQTGFYGAEEFSAPNFQIKERYRKLITLPIEIRNLFRRAKRKLFPI